MEHPDISLCLYAQHKCCSKKFKVSCQELGSSTLDSVVLNDPPTNTNEYAVNLSKAMTLIYRIKRCSIGS